MKEGKKNLGIFILCLVISIGFGWVMTYSGWDNPLDMVREEIQCQDGRTVLVRVGHQPPASCQTKEVTK